MYRTENAPLELLWKQEQTRAPREGKSVPQTCFFRVVFSSGAFCVFFVHFSIFLERSVDQSWQRLYNMTTAGLAVDR